MPGFFFALFPEKTGPGFFPRFSITHSIVVQYFRFTVSEINLFLPNFYCSTVFLLVKAEKRCYTASLKSFKTSDIYFSGDVVWGVY